MQITIGAHKIKYLIATVVKYAQYIYIYVVTPDFLVFSTYQKLGQYQY